MYIIFTYAMCIYINISNYICIYLFVIGPFNYIFNFVVGPFGEEMIQFEQNILIST